MSVIGAIRPDEWNLPLFLHVLGAMVLVGSLVTAAWFLFSARRSGSFDGVRWGWRTLLVAALPSYLLMRIAAEWIASEEGIAESEATWITIGFITSDAGALLLLAALIGTGLVVRRAARAQAGTAPVGSRGVSIAAWATSLLIVAYVVAIWAMTTKPV